MPLYSVTDERVLELLAAHRATCDVDQAQKQCYIVTRANGSTVDVPFGATMADWEKAINVPGSATELPAASDLASLDMRNDPEASLDMRDDDEAANTQ